MSVQLSPIPKTIRDNLNEIIPGDWNIFYGMPSKREPTGTFAIGLDGDNHFFVDIDPGNSEWLATFHIRWITAHVLESVAQVVAYLNEHAPLEEQAK